MEKINTASELKIAIQRLELKQHEDLENIKAQLHQTYESLRPLNLLKSTLEELSSSPYLGENLMTTTMALVSGFMAKKITVGSSDRPLKKIFGTLLQFGVANLVSQHSSEIVSFGQSLVHRFFRKKEVESEE